MFKPVQGLMVVALLLSLMGCEQDYGVDQHNQPVSAKSLAGKWLIINYWATWCRPCAKEIPEFNALSQTLEAKQVRIIGVNFDGLQGAELRQASEQMGIGFTVLAQDPAERFGIEPSQVLPITHIVDPKGRVRASLAGEQTADGITAKLKSLQE